MCFFHVADDFTLDYIVLGDAIQSFDIQYRTVVYGVVIFLYKKKFTLFVVPRDCLLFQ